MTDSKSTPLRVERRDRRTALPWQVRVGTGRVVDEFPRKSDAVEFAENKAFGDNRPGVIVFTFEGAYDRFIENKQYWIEGQY